MAFFDDFRLVKTKTGYSVKYKNEMLVRVSAKVIGELIRDYATQEFLMDLTSLVTIEKIDDKVTTKARQLEKLYTTRRRKYYKNKNLKRIAEKSPDFKHIIKAIKIIEVNKVTYKQFLDSQIEGLAFVNNGQGVFPKPSQLSNTGAEERLLIGMKDFVDNNDAQAIKRQKLTVSDKETPLMENPNFVSAYDKIRSQTASLKEAYFVNDCMLHRNGKVTQLIKGYISQLEEA